jgi:DNA 3'-phosphatase
MAKNVARKSLHEMIVILARSEEKFSQLAICRGRVPGLAHFTLQSPPNDKIRQIFSLVAKRSIIPLGHNIAPLRPAMKFLNLLLTFTFTFSALAGADQLRRQTILVPPTFAADGSVKVAFFDADSTLRVSKSGTLWASNDHDYLVLPGVVEKIHDLNRQGYFVAIVSNQGRISSGLSSPNLAIGEADGALFNMIRDLAASGAVVNYFDYAEFDDADRKPAIGMFVRLQNFLFARYGSKAVIDKAHSLMVGDAGYLPSEMQPDGSHGNDFSNSDRLFAENIGVHYEYSAQFFGWDKLGIRKIENRFRLQLALNRLKQLHSPCNLGLTPVGPAQPLHP